MLVLRMLETLMALLLMWLELMVLLFLDYLFDHIQMIIASIEQTMQ